jgi:hypothetical protein
MTRDISNDAATTPTGPAEARTGIPGCAARERGEWPVSPRDDGCRGDRTVKNVIDHERHETHENDVGELFVYSVSFVVPILPCLSGRVHKDTR